MYNMILTSDFSKWQLENYNTDILEGAKQRCTDKMRFHQNEINSGYVSEYHIEQLKRYSAERLKWIPIIRAAKERDAVAKAEFNSYFN